MPEFRRISKEDWAQYPTKPAGKADEWDDVMAALQAGETIELQASDDKHLRGMRIGLGRRAKLRGLQLEYRSRDNSLAVQMISSAPRQAVPAMDADRGADEREAAEGIPARPAPTTRRGRGRKAEAGVVEAEVS